LKKLLLILMLISMSVSAEMRVVEVPLKIVCWDSI